MLSSFNDNIYQPISIKMGTGWKATRVREQIMERCWGQIGLVRNVFSSMSSLVRFDVAYPGFLPGVVERSRTEDFGTLSLTLKAESSSKMTVFCGV